MPRLDAPRLFTEHVQRRKLVDRDARFAEMGDKVAVKAHVGQALGSSWVVPTLWRGSALPAEPAWPMPFVIKARHGCGQVAVVRDDADYRHARRQARRWMRGRYGWWLDEWAYGEMPLGLLVEPYLGEGTALPIDYKLFVFDGRTRFVQVHLGRATNHRWIVFDLQWRRVSLPTDDVDPMRPASLGRMIAAAETLGARFDFVRVDFYEVGGRPLFGELTFYPGSGLEKVSPPALDERMGAWWRYAIAASTLPFSRAAASRR